MVLSFGVPGYFASWHYLSVATGSRCGTQSKTGRIQAPDKSQSLSVWNVRDSETKTPMRQTGRRLQPHIILFPALCLQLFLSFVLHRCSGRFFVHLPDSGTRLHMPWLIHHCLSSLHVPRGRETCCTEARSPGSRSALPALTE